VRIPDFDVKGARWGDANIQERIAGLITERCGAGCLVPVAEVAPPPDLDIDIDCKIVAVPPEGQQVPRGSRITFLINRPCGAPPPTSSG
jgi:hypothetical protein